MASATATEQTEQEANQQTEVETHLPVVIEEVKLQEPEETTTKNYDTLEVAQEPIIQPTNEHKQFLDYKVEEVEQEEKEIVAPQINIIIEQAASPVVVEGQEQTATLQKPEPVAEETEQQPVEAKTAEPEPIIEPVKEEEKQDTEDKELKDVIEITNSQKLTLWEAYAQLSDLQRSYFNRLRKYANSKPGVREKETKTYLNIGLGNKYYIQLAIKKNTVVAYFDIESEEFFKLKLEGDTSVKAEKTKVKIVNEEAMWSAIRMIDISEEQVARELETIKQVRKEKQRQRYEERKKANA